MTFRSMVLLSFFFTLGAFWHGGGRVLNYPPPAFGYVQPSSRHGSPMTLLVMLHGFYRRLAATAPIIKTCTAEAVTRARQ